MKREFRTGNVFKLHDSLHIVTGERTVNGKEVTEWVSFEHENCKGTGYYKKEKLGMDRAVYLASNVKKYIIGKLLGNFDFKVYLSM